MNENEQGKAFEDLSRELLESGANFDAAYDALEAAIAHNQGTWAECVAVWVAQRDGLELHRRIEQNTKEAARRAAGKAGRLAKKATAVEGSR